MITLYNARGLFIKIAKWQDSNENNNSISQGYAKIVIQMIENSGCVENNKINMELFHKLILSNKIDSKLLLSSLRYGEEINNQ